MTNNLAVSHNERGRLELMMTRKFISCKSCNARDLKRRRRLRHGLSSFKTWCISNISGHALHRVDERHVTTILNGNGDVDGKDIDGGRRKSVSAGWSSGEEQLRCQRLQSASSSQTCIFITYTGITISFIFTSWILDTAT